jgi:hypothetical protein
LDDKYYIRIIKEMTKECAAIGLELPSRVYICADIYDLKGEPVAQNVAVNMAFKEPSGENYEVNKWYKVELDQNEKGWGLVKYIGEVSYMIEPVNTFVKATLI